jgi:peptide/nickel transport system permease protein
VKKSSNHDMTDDRESARKALLNARQAMQRGERQSARGWIQQAVALDPDSEEPWLFLAALASPRASVKYLEQALKIDPGSQRARKGMEWAVERLKRKQAGQSSKGQTQPQKKVLENQDSGRVLQLEAGTPATSEPKTRPRVQKNPAQMVARPTPSTDLHLPKAIAGTRWSRSLTRFSSRWQNWIGALFVSLFIIVALAAPLISPNNPKSPGPFIRVKGFTLGDNQPHSPVLAPPLGTLPGQLDVFHALIWGTRDALAFGLEVVILTAILGVLLGAIAGYAGGVFSSIIMRITDSFLAFPIIAGIVFLNQLWVSATALAGGFFDSYHNTWMNLGGLSSPIQALVQAVNPLLLILILFSWMPYARITNAVVTTLKQAEFIQAARAIGTKAPRIILRHLLPNSVSPSVVLAARDVGSMVILQATFTFIGLDGSSTWGKILVLGKDWVLGPGGGIFAYWWVFVPTTLVLVLFGIGWNLLGDGLSELLDPRDN